MEVLKSVLLQAKCQHVELAKADMLEAILMFKDLRPELDDSALPNVVQQTRATLSGTIPISFRGNVYNIPICIYLMDNHPHSPPMCYVRPTPDMYVKVTQNVDATGRVYSPYLTEWKHPESDLGGLLQLITMIFREHPPIFRKPTKESGSECVHVATADSSRPDTTVAPVIPSTKKFTPASGQVPTANRIPTNNTPATLFDMLRRQNAVLQSNAGELCTTLHPELFITHLRVKGIISGSIAQIVHREATNPAKIILLLDLLAPNPTFYDAVVEFLNQHGYTPLRQKIQEDLRKTM